MRIKLINVEHSDTNHEHSDTNYDWYCDTCGRYISDAKPEDTIDTPIIKIP